MTRIPASLFPSPRWAARQDREAERLALLREYDVLDASPGQAIDDLVRLAARLFGTPIALMSLVDADRLWFTSEVGLGVHEAPREQAFCAQAILRPSEIMVVEDATQDPRFADSPVVTAEPRIRFYAGAPLVAPTGCAIGTLCIIDHEPRCLDASGIAVLRALSRQVMAQLELRRGLYLLQQESCRDELTGLLNRRGFLQRFSAELQRACRGESPASLLFMDIDHFKDYNDNHGHLAGDLALRDVGCLLAACCREYDIAARWGGEEFVLALPATDAAGACALAERIRMTVQRHAWPLRQVTVSIGVATACGEACRDDSLLQQADAALYRSKREGRNRVTAADPVSQGRYAVA